MAVCDEVPPHHANMVHSWLSRSGDLDIHILISSAVADPDLVHPIIPFAGQIRTLCLDSPVACLLSFANLPLGTSFSRLTSFQSVTWGHPSDALVPQGAIIYSERRLLDCAPGLVTLSLRHKNHSTDLQNGLWLLLRSKMIGWPDWPQITHLDLRETELDIEVVYELLVQCKALVTFSAYVPHYDPNHEALPRPLHVLKCLKYFSLSATCWDESIGTSFIECDNLLRFIQFPDLDTLDLRRIFNPIPALSSQTFPLRSLFLTDSLRGCSSMDLCSFLQSCTLLEELQVVSCHECVPWFDHDFVRVLTYDPKSKNLPSLIKLQLKIRLPMPQDLISLYRRKLLHLEVARMVDSRWMQHSEGVKQWSSVVLCFVREPEWLFYTLTEGWYKELMSTGLKMTVEYGLVSVTSVKEEYLEIEDLAEGGSI
ncbi:hypothetical protein VKT23_000284 [Stygiomarasmius scandens]|uniref:Uncharacterized protein n=1 Tax=Marasmiellus scandens TaxID=2682957 RepID=A0ABR1K4W1_9AGAR